MKEQKFINKVYIKSLISVATAVLLVQLCSVMNNLVVGQIVGSDGLAIMSIVSPITFVFSTIGSLLGVGGSIQAAQSIGNQKFDDCNRSLYNAIKYMAVFGVIFTAIIYLFLNPLMKFLSVPDDIYSETKRYLLFFAPIAFASMGVYIPLSFFKIHGEQKYSVIVSAIMAVLNIGFDFIFAKALNMGIAGIGLATTLSYWISTVLGIIVLYTKKGGFKLPDKKRDILQVKKIANSGSPSAVNNLCHMLRALCLNAIIVSTLGKSGLSILSITTTVFLFSVTVSNGTSLTMAPFAAVFSSERDNKSIRQIFSITIISAIILMTVFVGLIEIFAYNIVKDMFSISDIYLIKDCCTALRIFAVSLIINGVNTVFSTFYQSIKHTIIANILSILRSFAFVVTFAFIITKIGSAENIWFGFLFGEIATLIVTFVVAFIYSKTHKHKSKLLIIDTKTEEDGRYLAFSVNTDNKSAAESAEKITEFCEQNELSPKLTMGIGIAIEEILVSFNEHAVKNTNNTANVRILLYDDIVILRFRVGGSPFDPVKYAEENDDILSDSMGIKMVQKLSEVVLYDRVFGLNNLTIIF